MYEIERYVDANTRGTAVLLDVLANDTAIRSRVHKLVVASSMSITAKGSTSARSTAWSIQSCALMSNWLGETGRCAAR
jgi:nucleoside-diphosphate-sugar epimerase